MNFDLSVVSAATQDSNCWPIENWQLRAIYITKHRCKWAEPCDHVVILNALSFAGAEMVYAVEARELGVRGHGMLRILETTPIREANGETVLWRKASNILPWWLPDHPVRTGLSSKTDLVALW